MSAIGHAELLALLHDAVDRSGSQKAFAATANVSSNYLADILAGRQLVPNFMAPLVGYQVRVTYEPIESAEENRPE